MESDVYKRQDQHTVLEKGKTIRDVLKSAFSYLFELEEKMNQICEELGTADEETMNTLMEELGVIQDTLTMHDFYVIDAKVEEVARALGLLDIGLDTDVTDLSGGQRTRILLGKLLLEKPDIDVYKRQSNYSAVVSAASSAGASSAASSFAASQFSAPPCSAI